MLKIIKKYKLIILLILIASFSYIGFIIKGFPVTDDGNWMVIRLSAFYEALRSGQFPVRFILRLNNGYGYPVSDFLYPLYLYIGSVIHLFGINFVNSVKVIFCLSLLSSALFSYLWLKKRFSNLAAFVGAIVYTYFPYHLYDIYIRGSVGEAISIALAPFILWQLERRSIFFTSIGISLLILSHNFLAVIFITLILIYGFIEKIKDFKYWFSSLVLGIFGASFFWLPALYDTRYTVFNTIQVSDFYGYLSFSNISYLGIIFLLIILLSSLSVLKNRLKDNGFFIFSVLTSFIVLILVLPFSKNFWVLIPFKGIIQFPFRLISIIIVMSTFQTAYLMDNLRKFRISFLIVLLFLLFISSASFFKNIKYQNFPDTYYSTNLDTTTVKNEYMPIWVKEQPDNYPSDRIKINGNEKINLIISKQNKINFQAYLIADRLATANIIYFPGWEVKVNNRLVPIFYNNPKGLITFKLFKGNNQVLLYFTETPIRYFADLLSIISIAGVLFLSIYLKKSKQFKL